MKKMIITGACALGLLLATEVMGMLGNQPAGAADLVRRKIEQLSLELYPDLKTPAAAPSASDENGEGGIPGPVDIPVPPQDVVPDAKAAKSARKELLKSKFGASLIAAAKLRNPDGPETIYRSLAGPLATVVEDGYQTFAEIMNAGLASLKKGYHDESERVQKRLAELQKGLTAVTQIIRNEHDKGQSGAVDRLREGYSLYDRLVTEQSRLMPLIDTHGQVTLMQNYISSLGSYGSSRSLASTFAHYRNLVSPGTSETDSNGKDYPALSPIAEARRKIVALTIENLVKQHTKPSDPDHTSEPKSFSLDVSEKNTSDVLAYVDMAPALFPGLKHIKSAGPSWFNRKEALTSLEDLHATFGSLETHPTKVAGLTDELTAYLRELSNTFYAPGTLEEGNRKTRMKGYRDAFLASLADKLIPDRTTHDRELYKFFTTLIKKTPSVTTAANTGDAVKNYQYILEASLSHLYRPTNAELTKYAKSLDYITRSTAADTSEAAARLTLETKLGNLLTILQTET